MNARARTVNVVAISAVRALVLVLCAGLAFALIDIVVAGWGELTRLAFYTTPPLITGSGGGAGPQIINTVYVLVLTMLFTLPIGLGAGIYFAEYAGDDRFSNACRRATEALATLPSIVVGLFGYALLVSAAGLRPSRLTAAMALVVVTLPYAVRVTEDAFRSVPAAVREGSYALGATKWQTVRGAVLPAALPNLVTGIILVAGRVFGEAAVILFTASVVGSLTESGATSLSPFASGDTLAVDLYHYRVAADPSTVPDLVSYADGVAALLVILVLVFNVVSRLVGGRLVRRVQGLR